MRSLQRFYLSDNHISGEIPSSIGQLVNATDFYLDNNRLSGKIPTAIGRMSSLQALDLSSNHLDGPIPVQISQLTNLQDLHLSFNPALNLRSPPRFLGKINLFQLGLADTGLVGVLPRWLASTSISTLDLSSNKLDGKMPTWIGNMTNLSNLNLSNNALESAIPEEFMNLTLLLTVDLHANKFTGPIRPVLAKKTSDPLGHYDSIDLSKNMFTGGIDGDMGGLPAMDSLTAFDVSYNPLLGGKIPKSMGNLQNLAVVRMAGDGLTGTIPAGVLNIPSLAVFDVSYNRLRGMIPAHNASLSAGGFKGNPGLCGAPLPPCKR
ncbi:uncharacterized protein A4U43_C05F23350 [Asparagus officinalis]|uniref:Leucine-rich repeat-containing N-terminal plant-type domain-containing protein n=1 Tax=Asparagus officinalis TaxID=4686 RepID=A0A5P1EU16_ASPOF|nr:uncharacterized protein A4U43_C05F23350 [Asparagus officinalis]